MKPIVRISLFFVAVIFVLLVAAHLWYLSSLNAVENYPEDAFLANEKNKKALIVTAHDDDAFPIAGTISKLIENGWEIRHICFKSQWGGEEKDNIYKKIAEKHGIKEVQFLNVDYRKKQEADSYMPIPVEKFEEVFNREQAYSALAEKIAAFTPSVIFSLDDQIGGYGHPDHVFISKLASDYFKENKDKNSFTIRRIYQVVYPPSMAEAINVKERLHNWEEKKPYIVAKQVYKVEGMPNPTTEINIYNWAKEKKSYMESFPKKDLKNIKKFAPAFHFYPYWLYFKIFDKEYFRVIE